MKAVALPLHFNEIEDRRPGADWLWTERNLYNLSSQIIHIHQIIVLYGQSHVVLTSLHTQRSRIDIKQDNDK